MNPSLLKKEGMWAVDQSFGPRSKHLHDDDDDDDDETFLEWKAMRKGMGC
jgi:hypothetical protein